MFGSILVGSVYSNLKPKPNRNFRFLKLKIETKLNRNFGNGSVGFGRFFRFVGFLHTSNPHFVKSCYQSKDFFIIYLMLLLVTFSYKPCLIVLNSPISRVLNLIHPFHTNGSLTWRKCSQFPCAVFLNGINFFLHGIPATILFHSFFESKRLMVHIQTKEICLFSLCIDIFQASHFDWCWRWRNAT